MTDQNADQTIVFRFLADAKDVLGKSQQLKEQVQSLKDEMKKLAQEGKLSYAEVARGMVEVSKIKMTENIAALRAEMAQLATEAKIGQNVVTGASRQMLQEIEAKKAAIQSERQAHAQYATSVKIGLQQINQEQKNAVGGIKEFFAGFAGAAGAVIGINSLMAVVQKLVTYLKEAAQAGKEFSQAAFTMVVGVRALQRAGVDITIKDVTTQIERLQKSFGVFVKKDLVVGTAAFLNLNRDMGFTKDQLFELQDAIATLAVVNGRSMDEVQKTVALALSSGYTEGLQRLGVSINRVTIAQEAARLGWEGGYTSLNEQQRALATYNLIIRKTNVYMDDLLEYQKTLPGRFDVATAAIENQTNAIGQELLPLMVKWAELKASYMENYARDVQWLVGATEYIAKYTQEIENNTEATISAGEYARISLDAYEEWMEILNKNYAQGRFVSTEDIIKQRFGETLGDVPVADLAADQMAEQVAAAVEGQLEDIQAAQEEFQDDSLEAWNDYQQDLEELFIEHDRRLDEISLDSSRRMHEIIQDYWRRVDDLALDNQRNLDDIRTDYERSLAELETGLANDIASIWANYYNSLASSEADYRNKQIDAEVKYQETLLRLRENFLFDLEDALQERDARQVLKLIRRYNLEKDQADRAFEQEMDRLRRQHEERLAELARQRDERLRQLYAEIEAKRIALELENTRKLEDEQRRYEREQADNDARNRQQIDDERRRWGERRDDEDARYVQEIEDRNARWDQELIDLDQHLQDRYDMIAASLLKELDYTDEMMEAVRVALNDTLGPGGEADAIYTYFTQRAIAAAAAAAAASAQILTLTGIISGLSITFPDGIGKPPKAPGFAEGGFAIANSPTSVTFGEGGEPELAAFIPLKDAASASNVISSLGGGSAGGGKVSIEVLLDKYLEGRIIDNAVDGVADVVLRRFRR